MGGRMNLRVRILVPLAVALVTLAVCLTLLDPSVRQSVLHRLVQVSKVAGALGCLAAALAFERGDYLRRAFAFQALSLVLLARDVVLVPLWHLDPTALRAVNHAAVLVANVAGAIASILLARAWQASGLDPPGTPAERRLLGFAALAAALAITGVPLARNTLAWARGADVAVFVTWVSTLTDATVIALMAPVGWTVIAMRGGLLGWPFALYFASMTCWLLYDVGDTMHQLVQDPALGMRLVATNDAIRVLACTFVGLSGLAQRLAIRSIREDP
jgi:hypothetical protein